MTERWLQAPRRGGRARARLRHGTPSFCAPIPPRLAVAYRSNVVTVVPDPAPPCVPAPVKVPVNVWLEEPLMTRTT